MSIPTHGPDCHTTTYPVTCRSCGQSIFVLQCTCGSAVLLNSIGWPWPHHECPDSDLPRGWRAIQKLRDMGVPIDHRIMEYAFGSKPSVVRAPSPPTLKKIEPESAQHLELIATLRECDANTKHVQELQQLGAMGHKMLNISSPNIAQFTLHDTSASPARSYRCLFPYATGNPAKHVGTLVAVVLDGIQFGSFATWIVRKLHVV